MRLFPKMTFPRFYPNTCHEIESFLWILLGRNMKPQQGNIAKKVMASLKHYLSIPLSISRTNTKTEDFVQCSVLLLFLCFSFYYLVEGNNGMAEYCTTI